MSLARSARRLAPVLLLLAINVLDF